MERRHFFPRRIKRVQQRNSNKHNYYFLFSSIHSPAHPLLSLLTLSSEPKNIDSVLLPTFPFPSSSTSYSPLVPLALLPVLSAIIVPNGAPCRRWKKKMLISAAGVSACCAGVTLMMMKEALRMNREPHNYKHLIIAALGLMLSLRCRAALYI